MTPEQNIDQLRQDIAVVSQWVSKLQSDVQVLNDRMNKHIKAPVDGGDVDKKKKKTKTEITE